MWYIVNRDFILIIPTVNHYNITYTIIIIIIYENKITCRIRCFFFLQQIIVIDSFEYNDCYLNFQR